MRAPTPVDVAVDAEDRLPERVEAAAYYVAAEALSNTSKHAEVSHPCSGPAR